MLPLLHLFSIYVNHLRQLNYSSNISQLLFDGKHADIDQF